MKTTHSVIVAIIIPFLPILAQDYGAPRIVAPDGTFLGNLSANPYDPNSVANPYGQYGSPYSPDSINNPYGQYGSPYSPDSVNNPFVISPIDPLTK
jgi:hypothetical protein